MRQDLNFDHYISASQNPGSFGKTVFNQLFLQKNIKAIYTPMKFSSSQEVITYFKKNKISGAAISQPYKSEIVQLVDELDPLVIKLKSLNTLLSKDGKIYGFNTDAQGALATLTAQQAKLNEISVAIIFGAGGVLASLLWALHVIKIKKVILYVRDTIKVKNEIEFYKKFIHEIELKDLNGSLIIPKSKFILINTIPIQSFWDSYEWDHFIISSQVVFDLTVKPELTPLLNKAKDHSVSILAGYEMAIYQLQGQFELYFNQKISYEEINEIVKKQYLKNEK